MTTALLLFWVSFSQVDRSQFDPLPSEEFEGVVPRPWLRDQWFTIDEEAKLLIEAFSLEPADTPAFLHVYYGAWRDQYLHDREFSENFKKCSDSVVAGKMVTDWAESAPARSFRLLRIMESLQPSTSVFEGRIRYSELRGRALNQRYRPNADMIRGQEFIRLIQAARNSSDASEDDRGRPIPNTKRQIKGPPRLTKFDVGTIIPKPETTVSPSALRDFSNCEWRRANPHNRPPIKGIDPQFDNVTRRGGAFLEVDRCAAGSTQGPIGYVDAIEDGWYRRANSAYEAVLAGNPSREFRASAQRAWEAVITRAMAHRLLHCVEYLALEQMSSRSEFQTRLAELDAPLEPLLLELDIRLKALAEVN